MGPRPCISLFGLICPPPRKGARSAGPPAGRDVSPVPSLLPAHTGASDLSTVTHHLCCFQSSARSCSLWYSIFTRIRSTLAPGLRPAPYHPFHYDIFELSTYPHIYSPGSHSSPSST